MKWSQDRWKFPPYVYKYEHGLIHKKKGWKIPGVNGRESISGLPLDYTWKCLPKQVVKSEPLKHEDTRLTLLGIGWSIQVASFLMKSLRLPRKFCGDLDLKTMLQRCMPGSGTASVSLNSYLNRPPWKHGRNPIKEPNSFLISRLGKLVSSKGNDILLTSGTEPVQSFDRCLPPHLALEIQYLS